MRVAAVCTALLGLLVFGLGFAVSMARSVSGTNFGFTPDPTDALYKRVRAHGNATEYAPMLAILILLVASRRPATWMLWTFVAATVSRYLHAAGMLMCPSLDRPYPLRFVGALGTYLAGLALVVAALLV